MPERRFTLIAPEARLLLFLAVSLALGFLSLGWYTASVISGLLALILVFYFRDPSREVPAPPLGILSPVDGTVVEIADDHDPWLDRPCKRITLQMSWFNSFRLRGPMEGKVLNHWGLLPQGQEAAFAGDRPVSAQHIQSDEADDLILCLQLPSWAGQAPYYVSPGERIGQGKNSGFLWVPARVHLLLPEAVNLSCRPGQRVSSGLEVLATLVH